MKSTIFSVGTCKVNSRKHIKCVAYYDARGNICGKFTTLLLKDTNDPMKHSNWKELKRFKNLILISIETVITKETCSVMWAFFKHSEKFETNQNLEQS